MALCGGPRHDGEMIDTRAELIELQQKLEQALELADKVGDLLLGAQIDTALQTVLERLRQW